MAIVTCPYCGGRISSLMKSCPHCKEELDDLSPEDRERLQSERWKEKLFRASQLSFLALALLLFGAIWWWFDGPTGWDLPPPLGGVLLVFFGAVLYVSARAWTFWLKLGRNRPTTRR